MVFRNYLNMSVLLVVSFVCLHFFEVAVHKKYHAYGRAMQVILEKQKDQIINGIQFCRSGLRTDDPAYERLNKLKSDFDAFEKSISIQERRSDIGTIRTKCDLLFMGNIDVRDVSVIDRHRFYNKLQERLEREVIKVQIRREEEEISNRHVIIKNRQPSYKVNEVYELEFQDVYHGNYSTNEVEIFLESNGKKEAVLSFPHLIDPKTDSLIFYVSGRNVVTGEMFSLKEIHKLRP